MVAIVDNRINNEQAIALTELGFEIEKISPADYLAKPVASHPDMLFFFGFGKLFCHRRYFEQHREQIEKICRLSDCTDILLSDELTGNSYPNDVLFNACLLGSSLLCNEKTVSRLILNEAERAHCNVINVRQGYVKCSCIKVTENSIITSDSGIFSACTANNIDVLRVLPGAVSLPGYDYGFIGGASGCFEDRIFFCGGLDSHPDSQKIKEFIKSHKKQCVSLGTGQLQDVGTMFFFQ